MDFKDVCARLDKVIALLEKQRIRRYKVAAATYSQEIEVPATKGLNEILFVNYGNVFAAVNGIPLPPGATWGNNGYENGVDETIYSLKFPGTGTTPAVLVTRKFFLD